MVFNAPTYANRYNRLYAVRPIARDGDRLGAERVHGRPGRRENVESISQAGKVRRPTEVAPDLDGGK